MTENTKTIYDYPDLLKWVDMKANLRDNIDLKTTPHYSYAMVWFKTPNGISYKRPVYNVVKHFLKDGTLPHEPANVCIPGFNDMFSVCPSLKEFWVKEKNEELGLDPSLLSYASGKLAYFYCLNCHKIIEKPRHVCQMVRQGHTFCEVCSRNFHTSFQEQMYYFYTKKIFPDAINGYDEGFPKNTELDIYIPSKKIGIEYDGGAWHKDKLKRDNFKYRFCREHGITLIRVCDYENDRSNSDFRITVNRDPTNYDILKFMTCLEEVSKVSIVDFEPDVSHDKYRVIKNYRRVIREKSFGFKNPELVKLWDYEKNEGVSPYQISANTARKFWFKSEYGSFQKKPNHLTNGRPCRHPLEGKRAVLEQRSEIVILYDVEKKTKEELITSDICKKIGDKYNRASIRNASVGTNHHYSVDGKYIFIRKSLYREGLIEECLKYKPTHYKITVKDIIDACLKCKNHTKFTKEYSTFYNYAITKGFVTFLPYYVSNVVPVVKMDKDGNIIARYESTSECDRVNSYHKGFSSKWCQLGDFNELKQVRLCYEEDVVYFF